MKLKAHLLSKTTSLVSALSLSVLLSACGQDIAKNIDSSQLANAELSAQVNADNIKAHIEFLADDTLLGRDTGSVGYQISANYIKSYFKQLGLTPMGDQGSFEQSVTFSKTYLEQEGASVVIENANGNSELVFKDDYLMSGSKLSRQEQVKADTVFVGYGVISPDFGYDDYQGLDVKGKVVVALTGRPDDLPSEEGAHLGSNSEKLRHAAERGAVGYITLHTPKREKVRPFAVSAKYAEGPRYAWLDKNQQAFGARPEIKVGAYLHQDKAADLFVGAKQSAEQVFAADSANEKIKGFDLAAKVTLASKSRHEQVTSPNIVAVLPGSDPVLKDEYVVYTAHLDHIGVSEHSDHQDKINNGALDNASGVAILLETARLLSGLPEKPKRSILFTVVTAEEKGLLGSSYYANNPTVPQSKIVANVNLDMPLILYPFSDIIAFGANHSSLGPIVERAAAKVDVSLSPDPMPEQAIFTRSDHYSFVKQGVPSVFLMTGFKSKDPNIDGGKVFREFLSTHYHSHSDEIELPIQYDAAAQFAEVNMMIGIEIANQTERPTWNSDSFFGKTFAQ